MPDFSDKEQFVGNVLVMCSLEKIILSWRKIFIDISFCLKAHTVILKYQWQNPSTQRKRTTSLPSIGSTIVIFVSVSTIYAFIFTISYCRCMYMYLQWWYKCDGGKIAGTLMWIEAVTPKGRVVI